jgi:hypothetical protein
MRALVEEFGKVSGYREALCFWSNDLIEACRTGRGSGGLFFDAKDMRRLLNRRLVLADLPTWALFAKGNHEFPSCCIPRCCISRYGRVDLVARCGGWLDRRLLSGHGCSKLVITAGRSFAIFRRICRSTFLSAKFWQLAVGFCRMDDSRSLTKDHLRSPEMQIQARCGQPF